MLEAFFRASLLVALLIVVWAMPWFLVVLVAVALLAEGLVGNRTTPHHVANSVVLITGASSGLGRELALQAARIGAKRVILVARRELALQETVKLIEAEELSCATTVISCDLTNSAQVLALAADVMERFGAPDVLVNNAGAGRWLHIEEGTAEDTLLFTACPYLGAAWLTQALVPAMAKRRSGHVLNITSAASLVGFRGAVTYGTARWAMRGFSHNLRDDLAELNIGCTLLNAAEIEGTAYFSEDNAGEDSRAKIPWLFSLPVVTMLNATSEEAAWAGVRSGTFEVYFPRSLLVPTKVFHDLFPSTLSALLRFGPNGRRR